MYFLSEVGIKATARKVLLNLQSDLLLPFTPLPTTDEDLSRTQTVSSVCPRPLILQFADDHHAFHEDAEPGVERINSCELGQRSRRSLVHINPLDSPKSFVC